MPESSSSNRIGVIFITTESSWNANFDDSGPNLCLFQEHRCGEKSLQRNEEEIFSDLKSKH